MCNIAAEQGNKFTNCHSQTKAQSQGGFRVMGQYQDLPPQNFIRLFPETVHVTNRRICLSSCINGKQSKRWSTRIGGRKRNQTTGKKNLLLSTQDYLKKKMYVYMLVEEQLTPRSIIELKILQDFILTTFLKLEINFLNIPMFSKKSCYQLTWMGTKISL